MTIPGLTFPTYPPHSCSVLWPECQIRPSESAQPTQIPPRTLKVSCANENFKTTNNINETPIKANLHFYTGRTIDGEEDISYLHVKKILKKPKPVQFSLIDSTQLQFIPDLQQSPQHHCSVYSFEFRSENWTNILHQNVDELEAQKKCWKPMRLPAL